MAPLAGPSVGMESFGRGENIGVVVEIPLAIDSLGKSGKHSATLATSIDNSDKQQTDSPQSQLHSNYSQRWALGI